VNVTALCSSESIELLLMGSWTDIAAEQHLMIEWSRMCRMDLHGCRRDEVYILSRDEVKVVQNGTIAHQTFHGVLAFAGNL
jgi:hypothetical protein